MHTQGRAGQPAAGGRVGDLLVFPLAGAYAWNISHRHFLMHEPPQMLFLPTA
jgi:diaminopimelate decarboxylase